MYNILVVIFLVPQWFIDPSQMFFLKPIHLDHFTCIELESKKIWAYSYQLIDITYNLNFVYILVISTVLSNFNSNLTVIMICKWLHIYVYCTNIIMLLFYICRPTIQGSTLTVARLPGATDFRWGQVKITARDPLGNSFNLQHFFNFSDCRNRQCMSSGKSLMFESKLCCASLLIVFPSGQKKSWLIAMKWNQLIITKWVQKHK